MKDILNTALIADFNKGDEKAFKTIYDQLYPQLRYFADKLTGNTVEAEDIVIETFMKLFQRHTLFDSFVNIRAFLYITVRNNCFNYLKSVQRLSERHKEFSERMENDNGLENEMIFIESLKMIEAAIENLPGECKRVMTMIYFEGLETSEVADRLNITVSTVRSHKSRAIQLLRIVLADKKVALLYILCTCISYYIGEEVLH